MTNVHTTNQEPEATTAEGLTAEQRMRDILRDELENPWGLPPLPSAPAKDLPSV